MAMMPSHHRELFWPRLHHANAGLFALDIYAGPLLPRRKFMRLRRNDQALRPADADPAFCWMIPGVRLPSAAISTRRKARLCLYSLDVFQETLKAPAYDRKGGLLYFYRSQAALTPRCPNQTSK
jgi:hypothetical protein